MGLGDVGTGLGDGDLAAGLGDGKGWGWGVEGRGWGMETWQQGWGMELTGARRGAAASGRISAPPARKAAEASAPRANPTRAVMDRAVGAMLL